MTNSGELAYEPVVGFQSEKAAQIAAFFVSAAGGQIDKLKLAKLQYLAERDFMGRYNRPMTYDELYSLPHGPICSSALNGVDGKLNNRPEWARVASHGRQDIHGDRNVGRDALDLLSDAEFDVLQTVWGRFGSMTASELRAYTHDPRNCPEYTEVKGRRLPITYRDVFVAVGAAEPDHLAARVEEFRRLELAFKG